MAASRATTPQCSPAGSGKTYSMGTGFDVSCPEEQLGIIPRAVRHLFTGIAQQKEEARQSGLPPPEFKVTAQFIEIYNEELIDLLCEKPKPKGGGSSNTNNNNIIRIQENLKRGIVLTGVENKPVTSAEEALACLKNGSLFRTTGATLMNAESSRSHAIFTLFIKQSRVERRRRGGGATTDEVDNSKANATTKQELVTLTAKFNFVDLAGSERLARTGAVGERAREDISINSGLLHLGNVISALGDRSGSKKGSGGGLIPYRDSKLTRVLQDSLGGNSVTTMIACIGPCDRDFVETLNTLRYANRAKNIKNKVVANQDSQTALITELRKRVQLLEQKNGELELNDVHPEKVKEDYEKRLDRLQADVRKFEALKREHASKEALKRMRQEIVEAKQQRVRLISQMKEQMAKHREEMQKNRLVINKLMREDQKKDCKIRNLEKRSVRQKMMLQRRLGE